MIETLTLITLCVLYLIFFRPGKTPPLSNPLVINRPGKYHITLAPHLNLAQPFIEAVAQKLMESSKHDDDSNTQYFKATDKHVTSHGHDTYLLAITKRDGILLFQAAAPESNADDLHTISKFALNVLDGFPNKGETNTGVSQDIVNVVQSVAGVHRIEIAQFK